MRVDAMIDALMALDASWLMAGVMAIVTCVNLWMMVGNTKTKKEEQQPPAWWNSHMDSMARYNGSHGGMPPLPPTLPRSPYFGQGQGGPTSPRPRVIPFDGNGPLGRRPPSPPTMSLQTNVRDEFGWEREVLAKSPEASEILTMEDVAKRRKERNDAVSNLSPTEVLAQLKAGNSRFWTGAAQRPELSAMERRQLILQQTPKVAVLGCADSRVPVEIVFDQGLGDIFAVRVAGNFFGDTVAGSLDYAVHHLHVPLVVVLGHEGCGAVKAARLSDEEHDQEPPKLKKILQNMKRDLASAMPTLDQICDTRARDREAVVINTRAQVDRIIADERMSEKISEGKLLVVGAFYEISSGIVDFFEVQPSAALGLGPGANKTKH